MMQRDERSALGMVHRHEEVLRQMVPAHHGEIYQFYGDGCLSIFHSSLMAVQCAFEMQKLFLQDPKVHVKMGIHIGEIYYEDGKIFGDGVNIASRIESIGQGGVVLFSRDVYEKIRNNHQFQSKSIGKFEFKNVDDPVEVFALTNPEVITPDEKKIDGKLKQQPKKKKVRLELILSAIILVLAAGYFLAFHNSSTSNNMQHNSIAVIPFTSLSGDPDGELVSVGLAEDILTQLTQIKDLKVISRSSSMQYKDSDKTPKTIAKELGVTTILGGSVRKYENNLRVSIQLIDGTTESLIWAEDFDRKVEDVLNVQRDVALAVSEKLKIALTPETKNRFEQKDNVDPEAYVNYQRGQEILRQGSGTLEEIEAAINNFSTAIKQDPNFAQAYIGLANAYLVGVYFHRVPSDLAAQHARDAAFKALELDPGSGEPYAILGGVYLNEKDLVSAEKNLRKCIELSPNTADAYERLAWVVLYRGRKDKEAIAHFEKAIQLDPLSTRYKGSFAVMFYMLGRYDEGIKYLETYLKDEPNDNYLLWSISYLYAGKGDYKTAMDYLLRRSIGVKTNWILGYCYAKTGNFEAAREILNNNLEKSKTQVVPDFMLAVQYVGLGDEEKAIHHLERSSRTDGEYFFILGVKEDPLLEPLHDHKDWDSVVKLMHAGYKI